MPSYQCQKCQKEYKRPSGLANHKCIPKAPKLKCEHCDTTFLKQSTFDQHLCIGKKKYIVQYTRIGLVAIDYWSKFNKIRAIKVKSSVPVVDTFTKSSEFLFFIEFSMYVVDSQPLYPDEFVEYIFSNYRSCYDWMLPSTFQKWTIHILKKEKINDAIQRSVEAVHQWAVDTSSDWKNFFIEVSPTRALTWVESGKISPWFIFGCATSSRLFDRLDDDEFNHIYPFIDPHIWGVLKLKHDKEYTSLSALLQGYGL